VIPRLVAGIGERPFGRRRLPARGGFGTPRRRRLGRRSVVMDDRKRKDEFMGKTIMGVAAVSLDGFIADDNDDVGPLFDWLGTGDVGWSLPGSDDEARSSRASADFMTSHYANTAANVIGRRLFDLTNGWDGKPVAYEHVFVVTHQPPTDWEHFGTGPFTFVDGVEEAMAAAKEFAGDRDVDVAGGQIGTQALQLGLIDQVVVNLIPVVFGSGRPFFATGALPEPLRLENPTMIVQGDRVTHLVYDVSR
jgi:dihydrofolate reductase